MLKGLYFGYMASKKSESVDELYEVITAAVREITQLKRELLLSLVTVKKLKAKFAVNKIVSKK